MTATLDAVGRREPTPGEVNFKRNRSSKRSSSRRAASPEATAVLSKRSQFELQKTCYRFAVLGFGRLAGSSILTAGSSAASDASAVTQRAGFIETAAKIG
jgi:hypothetical protein